MNARAYILPRPKVLRRDGVLIFASGFLAILAMTTIMYVLPLVGLGQVDLPIWTAGLFLRDPVKAGVLGLALHVFLGFGYAWLFADQIEPRLRVGSAHAGLLFGGALWLFAQMVAVPVARLVWRRAAVAGISRDSTGSGCGIRQPHRASGLRRHTGVGVWVSLGRRVSK